MARARQRPEPGDGREARPASGVAEVEAPAAETAAAPAETTELGIDIIRVQRIAGALKRFGDRFAARVLTPAEAAYVRN